MTNSATTFDSTSTRLDARCKEILARLKAAGFDKANTVYTLSQQDFPASEMKHLQEYAVAPFGTMPPALIAMIAVDPRENPDVVSIRLNFDIV
jgi:hypothetical protein